MTKLTVLFLVSALVYASARHIHPHRESRADLHVEEIWNKDAKGAKSAPFKEDYVNVEVPEVDSPVKQYRNYKEKVCEMDPKLMDVNVTEIPVNIKPHRFVPLNNALFFMGHKPCAEEGFKRDYMGICREVWD